MDDPLGETHLAQAGMNVPGPPQGHAQLLLTPAELRCMASPNRVSPLSSLSHRPARSGVASSSDFHQASRSTHSSLSVFRSNLLKSLLSSTPYISLTKSGPPLFGSLYAFPLLSPAGMGESKRDVHGTGGIRRRIEHYLAQHPDPHGRGHNTGEDHDFKSRCASSTPVVVEPYAPLIQPLSTWTPKSIMLEPTSDARIDRENIPNAHDLTLSSPSSVMAVGYSGSQSVPGLSLLILNHATKLPSPTASPEFLSFSPVPLPLTSSVKSEEACSLGKTHRLAHDSLTQEHEVMSSIKVTFLKGLSAFVAMFPSISPSCQIKSSDAGHLCAPDYRFDVDPINSDGCYIRVEFENPLSQHKPLDFVEYYFPAPSQTNICDAHFQCGSLVTIDPVGYQTSSHELDKLSQFAIPGDEHNGALPMSPEDLKTMKVVDAPIIVPCKTEEHRSAPLPTTVDDIQEQPATDKGEIGLGPGLPKQNKIQEIGNWKLRRLYPGTSIGARSGEEGASKQGYSQSCLSWTTPGYTCDNWSGCHKLSTPTSMPAETMLAK